MSVACAVVCAFLFSWFGSYAACLFVFVLLVRMWEKGIVSLIAWNCGIRTSVQIVC